MTVFYNDILSNVIKAHISKFIQSYAFPKFARISEFDPETGLVKVKYYNWETEKHDLESNWMAYMTQVNGRGDSSEPDDEGESDEGVEGELWGHHYGPNHNEQVYVIPHNGDHNNGVVIGSIFTEKRPPPTVEDEYTQSGEFLWKHKTGSYFKFFNDGSVTLFTAKDFNLHVEGDFNAHILGLTNVVSDGPMSLSSDSTIIETAKAAIILDAPIVTVTKTLTVGDAATGTFTTPTGQIVTVMSGIVTNIV